MSQPHFDPSQFLDKKSKKYERGEAANCEAARWVSDFCDTHRSREVGYAAFATRGAPFIACK
jgi:hypothetical protein